MRPWLPCVKGAGSRQADCGIDTLSFVPAAYLHPLRRGAKRRAAFPLHRDTPPCDGTHSKNRKEHPPLPVSLPYSAAVRSVPVVLAVAAGIRALGMALRTLVRMVGVALRFSAR